MTSKFEENIRRLTRPINDQLPRPWMTDVVNPLEADVFIVGKNQATKYEAKKISHQRHMDALFNRNGESCRALYNEVRGGKPSRTRQSIDRFVAQLKQRDVLNVIETDVVCYSTPKSADLRCPNHAGGRARGKEIFGYLLDAITPAVVVVYGAGSAKDLSRVLAVNRLTVPGAPDEICDVQTERHLIIPVPSLAPPAFNKWSSWSDEYLDKVADRVREKLTAQRSA